jgi:hypothetical protein
MSQVFDPYQRWLSISPENRQPDHYALLGLKPFESDPRAIRRAAADRAALVRPHQSGEHAESCTRLLSDLAAASQCLLNPRQKAEYDDRLRQSQDMGDTRSMSDVDLDVGSDLAQTESDSSGSVSRVGTGLHGTKSASPGSSPAAHVAGRAVVTERSLDDEPSSAADDTFAEKTTTDAGESTGGGPHGSPSNGTALAVSLREDLEAIATAPEKRRPLIVVVLAATAMGVLLVGMLGVVAALTGMRPDNAATGVPPDDTAPLAERDGGETSGNGAITPDASPAAAPTETENTDVSDATLNGADEPASALPPKDDRPDDSSTAETTEITDGPPDDTPADPPPAPPKRHPLPTAIELQRRIAQVQRTHGTRDLVSRRDVLDMAEDFIEHGSDPSIEASLQVAYLQAAMQLAGTKRDGILAFAALHQLQTAFEIDDAEADRLLTEALGDDAGGAAETWQQFHQARATLTDNPSDPMANLHLGVYYCFVRDDWERGLPHLARGEDTALRLLAETELTNVRTSAERLKLGDQWWDVSLTASPAHRTAQRERAASWYRLALSDLEGADKRRIQSRLASLIAVPPAGTPSGLPDNDTELVEPYAVDVPEEDAAEADRSAIDLTGLWKSDRGGSVFRLVDDGNTVRCELVTSDTVNKVNGLWYRDKGKLACDRWRFRFVGDPGNREWELGCQPEVVDEAKIRVRAEVVRWNSFGREVDRKWDATLWRKME